MDNEIDRKIVVNTLQFLLVQSRHQTPDCTLIGSGANGLGIAYKSALRALVAKKTVNGGIFSVNAVNKIEIIN